MLAKELDNLNLREEEVKEGEVSKAVHRKCKEYTTIGSAYKKGYSVKGDRVERGRESLFQN